jgi:hypothetical protein
MTADLQNSINGNLVTRLAVRFPWSGVWSAEGDFDQALTVQSLTGPALVTVGGLQLQGTFDPILTGTFVQQSKCHLHGGVNGWPIRLVAKPYHSDAGVLATTIAQDLARETGETLGDLSAIAGLIVGNDFVRQRQTAAETLSWMLGPSHQWFVDESGVTQIGVHVPLEIQGDYEVLNYDARFKVATVTTDDPTILGVGSVLRNRLNVPLWVKECEILIANHSVRFTCWGIEVAI